MNVRTKPSGAAARPADEHSKQLRAAAALEQGRRFFEARQIYLALLKINPDDLPALEAAARTATLTGDPKAAAEHLAAAVKIDPERDPLRERLIGALLQTGELAEAEEHALKILEHRPNDVAVLNLLGVVQKRRGRLNDALACFRKGTEVEPKNHSPWYNLGNTLLGMGDFGPAVDAMKRAAELKPKDSETMRLLGQALMGKDEFALALGAFSRAQDLDPKNHRIFTSRAIALQRMGADDAEVLAEIDKAIAAEPNNPEHMRAKAAYYQRRSRFAEAEAVHKELLAKDPADVETLLRLGHLLGYSLRRYEEANTFLRRALELKPNDPRCLSGLCKSLLDSRYGVESDHIEEAGKVAHQLIETGVDLTPHAANLSGVFLRLADYPGLDALGDRSKLMAFWVDRMNVGSLHNQLGRVVTPEDRRELVYWHREWGRRVAEQADKTPIRHRPRRTALRSKIRIGLMSSDLRDHPVAYFAMPIIEHYDRDRFEFVCYSFYPAPADRVQSFIQQRVLNFHSMLEATDQEIAQRINDDDLDILFELGGSTRYNRLEVMAYHAAPQQVSWLGYPHSAGIAEIDYILVDPFIKPDDPALLVEKPFIMPESWVVLGRLGFRDEPIEPELAADKNGFVTFGTMNNPYKYTPELFRLWAEVMNKVPDSRFLFVRPEAGAPSFRANTAGEFAKWGVTDDRLMYESVRGKHLRHYNRIDIALDSAPHTGGTTTCETLWMGCPTVTLVGEAFFERLSYSNLNNAGLGDLCAFTRENYVDISVELAKDKARLRDLRQNLRTRLRTSPLGDAKRWVKNFEATVDKTLGR